MDISYYYQILDIGILYEKGRYKGKRWKIGERKRLSEEVSFWINLLDLQKNIDDHKDKEVVYRILRVLHNLPKAMHGRNILNGSCNVMSHNDALAYAQSYMDEKMKEQYRKYFD